MENASKALIIAGGILLAMMILALMVYVGTIMTDMAESEDRRTLAEQTAEFNKSYLSYNKSRIYGTDVITVVNKAIDYNSSLDTDEAEYFINITLIITSDFDTTTQKFIRNANGMLTKEEPLKTISGKSLSKGTYDLKKNRTNSGTQMEEKILNFFKQEKEDTYDKEKKNSNIIETYTYSAITTFKTAIFKCTDVSYEDGRIKSMTFSQI